MPQDHDDALPFGFRALFAVICGYWLWVFFPPMQQLHLVTGSPSFIPVLLVLVAAQLTPYAWLRVIAGIVASEVFVWHYYHQEPANLQSVVQVFAVQLRQVGLLLRTHQLSDPLQTTLFLLSICIIYWLINYASRRPRLWVFYNGLGILVLAIIAGNTTVRPNAALVSICVIAVAVLGLSTYARLHDRAEGDDVRPRRYVAPLTVFVAIAAVVAGLLPKSPAVWADPFRSGSPASRLIDIGTGREKFIGYQETSAHLGGPFEMDQTPVLEVTTSVPQYLRGRVYDTYTGKGWTVNSTYIKSPLPANGSVDWTGTFGITDAPTTTVKQTIHVLGGLNNVNTVFGAYAMQNVKLVTNTGNGLTPAVDPHTLHVTADWDRAGSTYVVESQELDDPTAILSRLSPLPDIPERPSFYPADVAAEDLQLPKGLPSNIKTLTEQVVGNDSTEYEMVESVLNYLKENYTYQTQNVPVPTGNQDYVEQFLFQSKVGYCNNFSSAMAVMLRSINIPTRWVTGFTSGSFDTANPGPNSDNYIIRESDAHSWVEVYFPTVGWIPFDPTPNYDINFLSANSNQPTQTPPVQPPKTPKTPKPTAPSTPAAPTITIDWGQILRIALYVVIALLIAGLASVWVFRRRLRIAWYLRAWPNDHPAGLIKALRSIVRLARRDGSFGGNVTVRELAPFAEQYQIDATDYKHLVTTAETQLYSGQDADAQDIRKARQTWSSWIRQILSRNR